MQSVEVPEEGYIPPKVSKTPKIVDDNTPVTITAPLGFWNKVLLAMGEEKQKIVAPLAQEIQAKAHQSIEAWKNS